MIQIYLKTWKHVWGSIRAKWYYVFFVLLLLYAFMTVFGVVSYFLTESIANLYSAMTNDPSRLNDALLSGQSLYSSFSVFPEFTSFLKLLMFSLISLAIAYVIFFGVMHYLCARMLHKLKFWAFIGRFAVMTLVYTTIFLIVIVPFMLIITNNPVDMVSSSTIISIRDYVFVIFSVIWIYFALVAEAFAADNTLLKALKLNFVKGVKKVHYFLLFYIASAVIFLLIDFLITGFTSFVLFNDLSTVPNVIIFLVFSTILIVPAMMLFITYQIELSKNI